MLTLFAGVDLTRDQASRLLRAWVYFPTLLPAEVDAVLRCFPDRCVVTDDPHGQAERLRDAIVTMADRYGRAQAEYGETVVSYSYAVPEHISRTLDRRLAAVRRLADALVNLGGAS